MARDAELTLDEVAALTGLSARNVRAYTSKGLLQPPLRRGREVRYGQEHLLRLRLVQALRARGLTLRAIADLVARGVAEAELVRLHRARPQAPPARAQVRLGQDAVDAGETARAGLLEELADLGVLDRDDGGYRAEAAMLGTGRALHLAGMDLDQVAVLALVAGRAADPVVEHLRARLSDGDRRLADAAVEFATWAFAESLRRRTARGAGLSDS